MTACGGNADHRVQDRQVRNEDRQQTEPWRSLARCSVFGPDFIALLQRPPNLVLLAVFEAWVGSLWFGQAPRPSTLKSFLGRRDLKILLRPLNSPPLVAMCFRRLLQFFGGDCAIGEL